MDNKVDGQNLNKSGYKASDSESRDSMSSKSTEGNAMDYISGDSTPSSSSHQFPWIATDPKHDSKKSAKKTNS